MGNINKTKILEYQLKKKREQKDHKHNMKLLNQNRTTVQPPQINAVNKGVQIIETNVVSFNPYNIITCNDKQIHIILLNNTHRNTRNEVKNITLLYRSTPRGDIFYEVKFRTIIKELNGEPTNYYVKFNKNK